MSGDYDDLLNRTWEEIPQEQVLPVGDWLLKGQNAAFIKPKDESQSPKVLFSYTAQQPVEVDEDELNELSESGYDIEITKLSFTIFINDASSWHDVKAHLEAHGLTMEGKIFDDKGKLAFNKAFRKSQVVAYLEQDHWEDKVTKKTKWRNSLSNFRPVGD